MKRSLQKMRGLFNDSPKVYSDVESLLETLASEFWRDPLFSCERNWRPTHHDQNETEHRIEIDLPRLKKENVKVKAFGNTVHVKAIVKEEGFESVLERSFEFPNGDVENTSVKLEDGVLKIIVPKIPKPEAKEFEIK